ncbi:Uncharacterized protein TCM_033700 [Theobroma cacao]|uniref:Uncharacterized protein n=1 Tax=Theobroma cacao TaxID=3641 RepID=A0A061FIK7_THECC|nr:Uncharacterized protein TCM_033700 [Theobroma cacao]
MISTLESRVAKMEVAARDTRDRLEEFEANMEELRSKDDELCGELQLTFNESMAMLNHRAKGEPKAAGLGGLKNPHVTGGGYLSEKMTTSKSSLLDPVLEGRETCVDLRGKSASRDFISILDVRLFRVKVIVGKMRDCLDVQDEHLDELNAWDEELKREVQEMVRETLEIMIERNA